MKSNLIFDQEYKVWLADIKARIPWGHNIKEVLVKDKFSKAVKPDLRPQWIYNRICEIIENARGNIARVVNSEMVAAYWQIGAVNKILEYI